MGTRILEFPKGFLWGVATASHQNEGNNTNNDFWAWEQMPGHVVDGTTSALACNWWENPKPDLALMNDMKLNTLRISLEWSRIEPKPDQWDSVAIEKYRALLLDLKARQITPMITLHHFTNPIWLAEIGGWASPKIVERFAKYVHKAVSAFQDLCTIWCTINEPIVYGIHAFVLGRWAPGDHSLCKLVQVTHNQVAAHCAAYKIIHELQPEAQVGIAQHFAGFAPADDSAWSARVAKWRDTLLNWRFLDAIQYGKIAFPCSWFPHHNLTFSNTNDYLGINYYGRHLVKFSAFAPGELFGKSVSADPSVAWPAPWQDREIAPECLYDFLVRMRTYQKPIYVTENGLADSEDTKRPQFLLEHLAAVHRAIQANIPVRGFYHWTFVDNYEWVEGWTARFGLIGLNPKTQERIKRPSADLYAAIAQKNAITEDLVAQYAPQSMDKIFCK